ncbi:hypothetical protein T459_20581 [Capsicum annuum]|uniref:CHCH domain-containing protein n=1 Tax=Capsicum annuum TaxID=4072 RepID=A0A2G2Z505_CAPAN|nr:putative glutamine amidotransferaseC [Capsicum annuum]PHT77059.1 hypothetical protein T459_20581 [Capsicum annuum]
MVYGGSIGIGPTCSNLKPTNDPDGCTGYIIRRRGFGRFVPRPAPRAAPRPAPTPVHHAPSPAPMQSSGGRSMLGGIGSTISQGMAFGTRSVVAHRVVDIVMGPRTIQHEAVASQAPATAAPTNSSASSDACIIHNKAFQHCINSSGSDIGKCQFYMDMLSEWRGT